MAFLLVKAMLVIPSIMLLMSVASPPPLCFVACHLQSVLLVLGVIGVPIRRPRLMAALSRLPLVSLLSGFQQLLMHVAFLHLIA